MKPLNEPVFIESLLQNWLVSSCGINRVFTFLPQCTELQNSPVMSPSSSPVSQRRKALADHTGIQHLSLPPVPPRLDLIQKGVIRSPAASPTGSPKVCVSVYQRLYCFLMLEPYACFTQTTSYYTHFVQMDKTAVALPNKNIVLKRVHLFTLDNLLTSDCAIILNLVRLQQHLHAIFFLYDDNELKNWLVFVQHLVFLLATITKSV